MNIIIFGGFLGSGKTSLIISLAHFIVDGSKAEKGTLSIGERASDAPVKTELVIIENEIGETGIDDKLLKKGGYSVKELFAGCICCTLATDLTTTLNQLAEDAAPGWVIVECTGLAYPGRIIEVLEKYGKGLGTIHTVSVVDAERWEILLEVTPELVSNQVADGDTVLINKIDLVNEQELRLIEEKINEIKPGAYVERVLATGTIDEGIWRKVTGIA